MKDTPQIIRLEVSSQDVIRALEAEVERLRGEVSYLESECAVWKPLADRLLIRAKAAEAEINARQERRLTMATPSKNSPLTKKEESHLFWLKTNGATPEHLILAIMSAGRTRGWTPRYTAETIARFFIWKDENKTCIAENPVVHINHENN